VYKKRWGDSKPNIERALESGELQAAGSTSNCQRGMCSTKKKLEPLELGLRWSRKDTNRGIGG